MRAVVQRVTTARVKVGERVTGEIGRGLLVLLGVARADTRDDVAYMVGTIRDLRVFPTDADKPMDRSVVDIGGSVLVVSQFTLYGDMRKGRRPSFDAAARSALEGAKGQEIPPPPENYPDIVQTQISLTFTCTPQRCD